MQSVSVRKANAGPKDLLELDVMAGHHSIRLDSEPHLRDVLEAMIEFLLETRDAYGVVTVDGSSFIQVMALRDGGLRLESSASDKVLALDLGFDGRLKKFDHIAATRIAAESPDKEKRAAETMTRLVVEVHEVEFPADLGFHLDVNEYATSS